MSPTAFSREHCSLAAHLSKAENSSLIKRVVVDGSICCTDIAAKSSSSHSPIVADVDTSQTATPVVSRCATDNGRDPASVRSMARRSAVARLALESATTVASKLILSP